MTKKGVLIPPPVITAEKSLYTLFENRTIYSLNNCELNLFETFENGAIPAMRHNDFVIASMLRGHKIMYLGNEKGHLFETGETMIIPSNTPFSFSFFDIAHDNPAQCVAMTIDPLRIKETLDMLNERFPKEERGNLWKLDFQNYFFCNTPELANAMSKLMDVCMGNSIMKDVLAELTLQELLVLMIQSQTLHSLENGFYNDYNGALLQVTEFIKANLTENISMKDLSDKAYMSPTTFYRFFKRELGVSPIEYVQSERIKLAKQLLQNPGIQISEVSCQVGIEDSNYFIRLFKKHEGITPKQFQMASLG